MEIIYCGMIFFFFFLIFFTLNNLSNDFSDRYRWNQQGNWRCAGLWSLHAVGAAFFTGWITMLIARFS